MKKTTTERLGVAYGWRKNKYGKSESYIYAQVLPRQLLGRYHKPLVLSLKSSQTDDVLALFQKQQEVIEAAHTILRAQGNDMELPLWCYAMPAGPAKHQVTRGGQKGPSSDIFPVISLTPNEIDVEYLARFEAPESYLDMLDELATQSVIWSSELVAKISEEQGATENE
jgi:hypothetical protein